MLVEAARESEFIVDLTFEQLFTSRLKRTCRHACIHIDQAILFAACASVAVFQTDYAYVARLVLLVLSLLRLFLFAFVHSKVRLTILWNALFEEFKDQVRKFKAVGLSDQDSG